MPLTDSHNGFDCLRKGQLFDLNEIVQRGIAADPTGKPAPFAVGNFQAVVLTGAVGAAPRNAPAPAVHKSADRSASPPRAPAPPPLAEYMAYVSPPF